MDSYGVYHWYQSQRFSEPAAIRVPTFDGRDPATWIASTEEIFAYIRLYDDNERIMTAAAVMTGEAQRWVEWEDRRCPFQSWHEFTTALLEYFRPVRAAGDPTSLSTIAPTEAQNDVLEELRKILKELRRDAKLFDDELAEVNRRLTTALPKKREPTKMSTISQPRNGGRSILGDLRSGKSELNSVASNQVVVDLDSSVRSEDDNAAADAGTKAAASTNLNNPRRTTVRPKKTTRRKKTKTGWWRSHQQNSVRWERSSVSVRSRGATSVGTTKGGRTGGAAAARRSKSGRRGPRWCPRSATAVRGGGERQRRSSPRDLRKTATRSVGDGTKPTGEVDAWEVGARTKKKPAMRKPTPTSTARGKWSGLGGGFAARRAPHGDGGCIDTNCVRWWAGRSEERGWRLGSIVDRSGGRKRRRLAGS